MNEETSQLLIDPGSTRGHGSEASLLEDPHDDDSITRLHVDAIEINEPSDIIGTNSRITCHYQMSDPNLRWIKELIIKRDQNNGRTPKVNKKELVNVQKKLLKHIKNLRIIKDLIYLLDHDKFGNQTRRYVMPKNEIDLTIAELHSKETAGHLGIDKTLEKVKSRFFWINLSRDVKKFVRECHGCQKVKPPKAYSKPKLMPLAPTRTLVLITMDMAGPLPTTKRGNKYILVICDHFTKFVQAYALRGMTAEEVAEDAIKYCLIFGIPEAVLTDRGTNFTSQLIESLWERLDVHTLRTTAYHPQADGITERFNRTIKVMLAQFVDQHGQDDWDLKLDKLTFAYNTAVHATTKFSPFELMFGRIPKLPIDLVYDQTDSNELRDKIEVEWITSEYVEKQRAEM